MQFLLVRGSVSAGSVPGTSSWGLLGQCWWSRGRRTKQCDLSLAWQIAALLCPVFEGLILLIIPQSNIAVLKPEDLLQALPVVLHHTDIPDLAKVEGDAKHPYLQVLLQVK